MTNTYYDASGNPRSLEWMVRNEPEWAASRIRASKYSQEDIDKALAEQREACDKKYKALALQAAKDVEHWGSYANDYFATKWGLKDDIAKYMRLATDFQSPIIGGVEECQDQK